MSDLTISELALKAADEIERRGLLHGDLAETMISAHYEEVNGLLQLVPAESTPDCSVCMLGGLAAAYYGEPLRGYETGDPTYRELLKAVAEEIDPNPGPSLERVIYAWNDAADDQRRDLHDTADAVALLRRVAEKVAA